MKFISAQPDSDYYVWQLEVQMFNFKRHGIVKDAIILMGYNGEINKNAVSFARKTQATVLFYPDKRKDRSYIPSIRPHILKQFFEAIPNFIHIDQWMYHDSDIIFLDLPDFSNLPDAGCVVSDSGVNSYLNSKYIISKSESLFKNMINAVGIDPHIVINNDYTVGGAQYVFRFIPTGLFWNKVERDCNVLYDLMTRGEYAHELSNAEIELNDAVARGVDGRELYEFRKKVHPIQAWTSDMWAVLWNIWLLNQDTVISHELDFCWPTERVESKKKILHNSGVTPERHDLFYKQAYSHKSPFGVNFGRIDPKYCSSLYVQEIIQTGAYLSK